MHEIILAASCVLYKNFPRCLQANTGDGRYYEGRGTPQALVELTAFTASAIWPTCSG